MAYCGRDGGGKNSKKMIPKKREKAGNKMNGQEDGKREIFETNWSQILPHRRECEWRTVRK
jgi:hypothetical protein